MILLNKVYSGNYLEENIGHEFINDYVDDEGMQYIYVTPWQRVQKSNDDENYIIQIRYAGKKRYEVLFYAKIENFSVDNDGSQLEYGGFKLEQLLRGNDTNSGIYAHLKAEYIKKCNPNTYLCTDDFQLPNNPTKIKLNSTFNFGRQRRYIHKGDNVYDSLLSFIKDNTKWRNHKNSKLQFRDFAEQGISILDVVGKQYEELAFSNWLAFYLNNSQLCKIFITECLFKNTDIVNTEDELLNGLMTPRREYLKTDLWIESKKAIIVIENKIDSRINGTRQTKDGILTQLDDYKSAIEKEDKEEKQPFCFIIKPNYNQLSISEKNTDWIVIEYKTIHLFFDKISKHNSFKDLPYIHEFVKALEPLTKDRKIDYKDIIENRLMKKIAELRAEKGNK